MRDRKPCPGCGEPVCVTASADGRVILDPRVPVYVAESDGEGKGGTVVARDRSGLVMARHTCKGREAK